MVCSPYTLGLFFIFLVALIWAAASVLVQHVYTDYDFRSPFMLTYIGVSLFTLWLPANSVTKCFQRLYYRITKNEAGAIEMEQQARAAQQHSYQTVSHEPLPDDDDEDNNLNDTNTIDDHHTRPWNNQDHLYAAMKIAPVWFVANWAYNASLAYTSITSSTVLASTSSIFTFLFAVLSKDESFGWLKLGGVLLGVGGSTLTALHDATMDTTTSTDDDGAIVLDPTSRLALWGDFLSVVSALGYGAYAVQTRLLCPKDESLYSMQLILGYIGLCNLVVLSPIAAYLLIGHVVTLTWIILGMLVLKGLFDNVISDYLWLRAVILTDATVATVGLGLTIPLAFASDMILGKPNVLTAPSIIGALAVLMGFVFVNLGHEDSSSTTSSSSHVPVVDADSLEPVPDAALDDASSDEDASQ